MPAQTTPISVGYPDSEDLKLRVTIGACKLVLSKGTDGWISGTYRDPSGKIPITVEQQDGAVRIRQRPDVESLFGILEGAPVLELTLGVERAFVLELDGGANEFDLALGGIPLRGLEIKHGAGKVAVSFEAANPAEMDQLRVAMGAGAFEATGLANANFTQFVTEGGAASFDLGFEGTLRRSASVRASTGAASVVISVPPGVPARIRPRTTLGTTEIRGEFVARDGEYSTGASSEDDAPELQIDVSVAVGLLRLISLAG